MSKTETRKNSPIFAIAIFLFIFGTFMLLDVWLRVSTRWINRYSIYALEPNLFSLFWSTILTVFVTVFNSKRIRRVLYGVIYFLYLIYVVIQYGAYLILGKFLWFSDFLNAGEGADYASWVIGFITPGLIIQMLALISAGVIGILFIAKLTPCKSIKMRLSGLFVVVLCIIGIGLTPKQYNRLQMDVGTFNDPALEYDRFSNANYDMELTGVYQYVFKDISGSVKRAVFTDRSAVSEIEQFFGEKNTSPQNSMSGIFQGKNLIVIQLETIDDWMITEADMPATYHLMNHGINFSQLHTPGYGGGYTFNTEFAFNTGVYPYSNGNVTYSLTKNTFRHSIANTFARAGYSVNSYHAGAGSFYNRGEIHEALGYEKYYSYHDYPETSVPIHDDCFLTECDKLFSDVTGENGTPFYSFLITFTAHLPYSDDNELVQYALSLHPEYDVAENRELNILRAKARLTDDMMGALIERLDEKGILEDTVIVAYTDHYAYGLSDTALLQQLSAEAGSSILERTPAFIYCADLETPINVDKVSQITDLAPTIMNLFGLEVPVEIMGCDIFDETYSGFAIFPDNTWINNTTYVKSGIVQWNNGMSNSEIAQMNQYVTKAYYINDAILNADYYSQELSDD